MMRMMRMNLNMLEMVMKNQSTTFVFHQPSSILQLGLQPIFRTVLLSERRSDLWLFSSHLQRTLNGPKLLPSFFPDKLRMTAQIWLSESTSNTYLRSWRTLKRPWVPFYIIFALQNFRPEDCPTHILLLQWKLCPSLPKISIRFSAQNCQDQRDLCAMPSNFIWRTITIPLGHIIVVGGPQNHASTIIRSLSKMSHGLMTEVPLHVKSE
jgi:hypothetical protein